MKNSPFVILFIILLILFAILGAIDAKADCSQELAVCQESCQKREGVYLFQCYGPGVTSTRPYRGCTCMDEIVSSMLSTKKAK